MHYETSINQGRQLLQWYLDAGVDEAIADEPMNYFIASPPSLVDPAVETRATILRDDAPSFDQYAPKTKIPTAPQLHHSPSAAAASARVLADSANTLAELEEAVRGFDGCAIKKTASKTVFCDGNPQARVMIIGEAPGAQEDVQGIPFCGASGILLNQMLAAIGLSRQSTYISNTVFWRPPGNRQPSPEETAICLPFVEKHIALIKPDLLVLSGGTATTTLLKRDASISKMRGKLYEYTNDYIKSPLPVVVTFHPSYLLRTPTQKRLAWHDLLMIQDFLENNPGKASFGK